MKKPELLLPAGSLDHVKYAIAYGADAVYAGQPRYSLRVRNNDFSQVETIREAIDYCHARGKKFYLVVNIAPHNSKIATFLKDLEPVIALNPDALIMSDPGMIMMVQDHWPLIPIHLSVQMNTVNVKAVEFWQRQGIERVILSRELSLDEIEAIRLALPDMQLQVFVHGALCIAYSGRCLLSGYMNRRDPNQGTCTNACRWDYGVNKAKETPEGNLTVIPVVQEVEPVLLEDKKQPGELMPAYEDEHGTYILNSKDLNAIEHVARLSTMGIDSLKIEGRTKSVFYVARVAQAYRQAIDLAAEGKPLDQEVANTLKSLANRGYTEGFLRRHKPQDTQNYQMGYSRSEYQQYVGEVIGQTSEHFTLSVKNRFSLGDTVELMTPQGNHRFILQELYDEKGHQLDTAKGSGYTVSIPLVEGMPESMEYALLLRDIEAAGNREESVARPV